MSPTYVDRIVTVGGQELHYQEWSAPAGAPTLLMVHGVTMQSHAFDAVAQSFAPRYRCLAMDLRGHGDSARSPAGKYSYADYAGDVIGLLDALGLKTVHYIGTSLGGRVGMTVAASQPARFESAILNDISPDACPAGLARIVAAFMGARQPFASVEDFVRQVLHVYSPRVKALPMEVAVAFSRWYLREADGGWRTKFDPLVLQRLVELDKLPLQSEMLWQGFRNLHCPVLVVRAEHSDILSAEAARAMLAARPQAKLVELAGATHAPALIEPEAQVALREFFGT